MSTAAVPPEPSSGEPPSPRWSRFFHQSDDPLFVLNARRRIVYVNPAWEGWAALKLSEVRGQPCRTSLTSDADRQAALLGLLAPSKEALSGQPSSIRRRGLAGMSPWIDVFFFPCKKDGHLVAILGRIASIGAPSASKAPLLPEKLVQLRERAVGNFRLEHWESDDPASARIIAQARLASQTAVPVLLLGPRGCGREWLARTIHRLSPRREEFFTH